MVRKTVSLSVDEKIYNKYKKYCGEREIILSKQFEIFMKKELEKRGKNGGRK
jgi:hypothetical protein